MIPIRRKYLPHISRLHRWTRGDWQLLPWLCARVPSPKGKTNNPLNALSRYKIFDNLRRSVIPIVKLLAFGCRTVLTRLLRLCYGGGHAPAGRVSAAPRAVGRAGGPDALPGQREIQREGILYGAKRAVYEYLLGVTMLVYGRTRWRTRPFVRCGGLAISKKHMLSWVTAQAAENGTKRPSRTITGTWVSPLVGVLLLASGLVVDSRAATLCAVRSVVACRAVVCV